MALFPARFRQLPFSTQQQRSLSLLLHPVEVFVEALARLPEQRIILRMDSTVSRGV